MNLKSILILCLFFAGWPAYAQNYTIDLQAFGVEDGLLHRNVLSIFEDKDGIFWIGSEKGLQRFDGHDFKAWTIKNTPSVNIAHITSIAQDQEGWLWLWNNHSLEFVFLHPKTENVLSQEERFGVDFPVIKKAGITGWNSPNGGSIRDSKGRLYFLSSAPNELIVYDAHQGFHKYPLPLLKADFIELYFIDSKDHIWITASLTNSTLYKIDTTGNILNTYDHSDSHDVYSFSEYNGEIYYEVSKGANLDRYFYKIDASGKNDFIYKKTKNRGNSRHSLSFIWDKNPDGWLIYNRDQVDPVFELKKDQLAKQFTDVSLPVYEDSQGRFWFASVWGLGLAIIKPSRFQKYFSFKNEQDKPINNSARGILVDGDIIYANFEFGGLVSIPKNKPNQWTIIDQSKSSKQYVGRPLAKATSGGLYVGYDKGRIHYIDPSSKAKTSLTIQDDDSNTAQQATWSFYTAPDQTLWIGRSKNLAYKPPEEDHLILIQDEGFLAKGELIQHIYPDKNGQLWLSGTKGLYLFDPDSKSFLEKYGESESGKFHLPVGSFYTVYIDPSNIFWLGTNEGLLRWDRTSNEKRRFTTIDGLSNDIIYTIFEDDYQNLWLSSDYGIMQFNKETFHVNAFLEKDGIAHKEFNRIAAFQAEDGTIYFGGLNGITAFHPKDFLQTEREQLARMMISDFEIFDGQSAQLLNKLGELRTTNTINFYPDDRFFRLSFALPKFKNAKKVRYAWQVEEVDKDWNYQKENTIQIGKLPYGQHLLRVKGQNDDGTWSPHELAIQVNVHKPFYLQFWFLSLSLLSGITGLFFLFRIRTRALAQRQELLEIEIAKATEKIRTDKKIIEAQSEELRQLDMVKSNFFVNVSHELRTPLTLILGPINSVLKRNQLTNQDFTHLKKAQQSGKDLLKLIASILNLSKMESGKLDLVEKPVLLFPLIRRIASAFESHAQRRKIRFSFEYLIEKNLQLELDKDKLEIIFNNLLSNAIKFTQPGGEVAIKLEDLKHAIKIRVADTGRGIHPKDLPFVFDRFYQSRQADAPTEGGTGIGLALSRELTKMMGGKIWVESEFGKGSTFFLQLPRKEILGALIPDEQAAVEPTEAMTLASPPIEEKENTKEAIHRPLILIVEDNYSLRDYLQSILQPIYKIQTAENGLAALDFLKNNQPALPALVISDIMMPVMDGFQLLKELKSKKDYKQLPVIMLTARADIQDKVKALRIGVDDYLLKPFEEEELLVRIENLLSNHQERLEAQAEYQLSTSEAIKTNLTHQKQKPAITFEDQEWLEALERHLKTQISNSNYTISQLALDMNISERQLRRRTKMLIGLSPNQYLKEVRIQAARQMLELRQYKTVAQVAAMVGFKDPGAFSRNFSKHFGKSPSEYLLD